MSLEVLWSVGPEAVTGFIDKSEGSWNLRMSLFLPSLFILAIVLNEGKLLILVSHVSSWSLCSFRGAKAQMGRDGSSNISLSGINHDSSSIIVSDELDLSPGNFFPDVINVHLKVAGVVGHILVSTVAGFLLVLSG